MKYLAFTWRSDGVEDNTVALNELISQGWIPIREVAPSRQGGEYKWDAEHCCARLLLVILTKEPLRSSFQ